jgi:phage FluMu protein Com
MPCPSCGKEVEFLWCSVTEHATYAYDGEEFELKECVAGETDFRCPHCGALVARNTNEARTILKGKPAKGMGWERLRKHAEAMRKAVEELARHVHEEEARRREASALAELVHEEERRRREASRATED